MKKSTTRIKRTSLAGLIAIGVFFGVWFGKDNETEEEEEEEPPEICLTSTEDLLEPFVLTTVNDIEIRPGATESSMKAVTEVRENSVAIREAEEARIAEEERLAEEKRIAEEARLATIERERIAEEERKKKKEEAVTTKEVATTLHEGQNLGTFNVSWYGSDCVGCSGITASGISVVNSITYNGMGIAAADWSVLPPRSIIEVEGHGRYIILDKGGAIKGRKLDLLTTSEAKSNEFGRQHLNITLIRRGS